MKAICAKRNWQYDANATAKALLQVLFDNGLIPAFWSQHFSALRATLEAGVPPARPGSAASARLTVELKLPRCAAVTGEGRRSVAVRILIDDAQRLGIGLNSAHAQDRPEDLVVVAFHAGLYAVQQRGSQKEPAA